MNSRQRAYLGSLANNIDPIFQIGKASLTPEIIEALDAALVIWKMQSAGSDKSI